MNNGSTSFHVNFLLHKGPSQPWSPPHPRHMCSSATSHMTKLELKVLVHGPPAHGQVFPRDSQCSGPRQAPSPRMMLKVALHFLSSSSPDLGLTGEGLSLLHQLLVLAPHRTRPAVHIGITGGA